MRPMPILTLLALVASGPAHLAAADATRPPLPYPVYADGATALWVASGWIGETGAITMDGACTLMPHSGATCLRVAYAKPDGWGGVVWQDPVNDWGDAAGGKDLSGATRLSFWARGAAGGEKVKFGFGVIGADKPFHDSAKRDLEVTLTAEWREYDIDVAGADLTRVKTGFMWVVAGQGQPLTFFLDDIGWQ